MMKLLAENWTAAVVCSLLLLEVPLCVLIIHKISYTEIDWIAYMQEVQGYEDGERNYFNLKGDTGPLVYPAGFLYIFSALKSLTDDGDNILKGQIIFACIYFLVLAIILKLYAMGKTVPAMAFTVLVLSKRIHSIFILRMFNDCVAVLLGYAAIYCFTKNKWNMGSVLYSGAVSVKMNMLLFAPGVLLCFLLGTGYAGTIVCLSICAGLQLLLGLPFLTTFPYEYLKRSFDLGRVFMFKWTVNFKFLPEDVFISKELSIALLLATVAGFAFFASKWVCECQHQHQEKSLSSKGSNNLVARRCNLSPNFILVTIFTSNFIGIVFARSLHYQFYCWYFHTIPYLLWHVRVFPVWTKLAVIFAIEICFNVYPAQAWSSSLLQACHLVLLAGIYVTPVPAMFSDDEKSSSRPKKD